LHRTPQCDGGDKWSTSSPLHCPATARLPATVPSASPAVYISFWAFCFLPMIGPDECICPPIVVVRRCCAVV